MSDAQWNVETLRQYTDQRFEAQKQAVDAALAAVDKAITKAENATERRFESVNEFRQTLTDQTATFMTRIEADQRLRVLEGRMDKAEGSKSGIAAGWGILVGVIGVVAAVVAIVAAMKGS